MTAGQRVGYWLSEWTIAFLLLFGLFAATIVGISEEKLLGLGISALLFVVMFGPVALFKRRAIQKSNARVSEAAMMAAAGKMA